MKKRVKKIFKNCEKELDAILIKNTSEKLIDTNFFYATALKKGLFENSVAVLYPDGEIDLIIPFLEEESAKKSKDSNIQVFTGQEEYVQKLKQSLKNTKKIGLNFKGISYKTYKEFKKMFTNIKFFDVEKSLDKTRSIKDEKEISFLKNAACIVDQVVEKIPSMLEDGMYEYELAAEVEYLMGKLGADKPAFETISSFGENTAAPHYTHGKKMLSEGDFVLCDFGANYMKYNSDTTRTFVFNNASEKQKQMYDVVKKAQKKGLDLIKPGVRASDIHKAVFDFIENSSFKGCFIHSTGHSLGLDVHDPGFSINSKCDVLLEENMVFTVEPGVYMPGFGGVRIEDDVVVASDGFEFLTQSDRELKVV